MRGGQRRRPDTMVAHPSWQIVVDLGGNGARFVPEDRSGIV